MEYFDKPENLNGLELIAELKAVGLEVEQINDNGNGKIYFETNDRKLAAEVVKAHNGNINPIEPTVADKLASVGLNLEDLKTALGI